MNINWRAPEVIAAIIAVQGSLLVGLILAFLEGRIQMKIVVVFIAILLIVALLFVLYRTRGAETTSISVIIMVLVAAVVYIVLQNNLVIDPPGVTSTPTLLPNTPISTLTTTEIPTNAPSSTERPTAALAPTPSSTQEPTASALFLSPTVTAPTITDLATLIQQLNDANVLLAAEPTNTEAVRKYLNGATYRKLAENCLTVLEGKRVISPVYLDTINGRYKNQFGVSQEENMPIDNYNAPDKLEKTKAAILNQWNEMQLEENRRGSFEEIVEPKP